jgi:uncharacterized membrane protein HdeD (DUF308 family)
MRAIWESLKSSVKSAAAASLRAMKPPVTPVLILKVLLGIVLFFSGIVLGVWLIIRYRRRPAG